MVTVKVRGNDLRPTSEIISPENLPQEQTRLDRCTVLTLSVGSREQKLRFAKGSMFPDLEKVEPPQIPILLYPV